MYSVQGGPTHATIANQILITIYSDYPYINIWTTNQKNITNGYIYDLMHASILDLNSDREIKWNRMVENKKINH